ncbi:MAG TPA: amino acid permease [Rhizomicrobium sp.]|jgi:APA family basic amino acid/polyamine antiporter|nr:amino acid permease [Rhizomicrobium sp.]
MAGIFTRKPVAQIMAEFESGELKRTLGAFNLVTLGIGCIIGAGIFVLTGHAAATMAGPAVIYAFIISGLACAFAGLCYAELASTMPVSGSAYSYSYVTLGEIFAWSMGWLLLLEYGIAASTVAAGWTGYVVSLARDFGIVISDAISHSTMQYIVPDPNNPAAHGALQTTGAVNIIGALGILGVTALLVVGVHESARVNNVIVVIKVTVLLAFIVIGYTYIDPANWHPFIPKNEGSFHYGWPGILRAASYVFFAYVGFEAVSTAAGEAKRPQRDLPIGILGSLVVCTVIYMAVAAVLTGVVPFRTLNVPDPIAVAVDRMNPVWAIVSWPLTQSHKLNLFSFIIKIGAFTGLSSVMLVLCYAQTRVFYQMAKDGLLMSLFGKVNQRFKTPAAGTILLGGIIAVAAAVLPLDVMGNLVSLGTALAFAIVCITVIYMRRAHPEIARPFKVPFYPLTPILGVFFCVVLMMGPILLDISGAAMGKDLIGQLFGMLSPLPAGAPAPSYDAPKDPIALYILVGYIAVGALLYIAYGYRHSKLRHGVKVAGHEPPPGDLPH